MHGHYISGNNVQIHKTNVCHSGIRVRSSARMYSGGGAHHFGLLPAVLSTKGCVPFTKKMPQSLVTTDKIWNVSKKHITYCCVNSLIYRNHPSTTFSWRRMEMKHLWTRWISQNVLLAQWRDATSIELWNLPFVFKNAPVSPSSFGLWVREIEEAEETDTE